MEFIISLMKANRFDTIVELSSLVPFGAKEFEVSQAEYDHYESILFGQPVGKGLTVNGVKLIVKNTDEHKMSIRIMLPFGTWCVRCTCYGMDDMYMHFHFPFWRFFEAWEVYRKW